MRTAFMQALIAIVTTVMIASCSRQIEPFPAKTPEQTKQLTDVTDSVLALVRNPDSDAALRQALAALDAASEQYRQHKDAIGNQTNAEMIGCIHSNASLILDLETMLAKRDEAARQQDVVMVNRRDDALWSFVQNIGSCAATSPLFIIDAEHRPEALEHGAVVMSESYSTAVIARAAAGLKVAPLLRDQIRTYETIVTRLGPEQEVPVATDALPKLRATLATLE
jgi:hypothetical protein